MKKFLFLLIATASIVIVSQKAFGSIQVDSVKATASTCQNNGSITVYAITNRPPLSYSITTGPVTRPQQTSNIFSSLPAGNYTIRVINASLEVITRNVVVTGTYLSPVFNPKKINPYCAGAANGTIIGNPTTGTGQSPYNWQLVAPSPVLRGPQANDTFANLPAGNYTMRVTDGCGSYLTYVASLFDPNTKHLFYGTPYVEVIGCDSILITSFISLPENAIRLPLSFKYKTKNGVLVLPPDSVVLDMSQINSSPYGIVSTKRVIAGLNYGDTIVTTVYNSCGDSVVATSIIPPFAFYGSFSFKNCGTAVSAVFNYQPNGGRSYGLKAPVKYVLSDSITGAFIESGSYAGDPAHFVYAMIASIPINAPLLPGTTYTLDVTDGCGKVFQHHYRTPVIDPPAVVGKMILNSACADSLAGTVRVQVRNFYGFTKLILLSGPATAGSNRPGYSYSDILSYPDTIIGGTGQQFFYLLNMAPGVWKFKVEDDCGSVVNDSIVIKKEEVTSLDKTVSYRKGCLGQNTIFYSLTHGATVNAGSHLTSVVISSLSTGTIIKSQSYYTNTATDSLPNLSPGGYVVSFQFKREGVGTYITDNAPCATKTDTVIIENYQGPAILSSNSIVCNNSINIELLPDSTKGVPPYQYEIIAGPSVFPVQSSNIFTPNTRGTYTARIYDACGNASTTSISVDTFSFSPLGQVKTGCNSLKFFYTSSSQFTYTWIIHGSEVFSGDTLIIDPVTPADTGTYYVTKVVGVNGCRDTFTTSFTVELPGRYNSYETICEGNSFLFGGIPYNSAGVYNDTLQDVDGCDSINILHLSITPYKRDTVALSICEGDSLLFNSNTYYLAGAYPDTLSTSGCDSIILLNLTVDPYKRDTLNIGLCSGQSFTVGSNTYNQTGTYVDTLSTAACDSIVLLNLYVNDYKRDTLTISICEEQSYTMGGTSYSQTGVYTDTLTTVACDSIVLLNLTVNPFKRDTLNITICEGNNFIVGANSYSLPGNYIDTLTTGACDSIVVLNLSVTPYSRNTLNITICEGQSFTIGNNNYFQTGTYTDTLTTAACDSIVLLNLTVSPYKRDTLDISICEGQSFTLGNNSYSQTGIYADTLPTLSCDSIVLLNLTVNPYKRDTLDISLCSGQSFTVGSNTYDQTGTYIDTLNTASCDSIVLLQLYINDYKRDTLNIIVCEGQSFTMGGGIYSQTGIYTDTLTTASCDSIVLLNLTVNPYKRDTLNVTICEGNNFIMGGSSYSLTGTYSDTLTTTGCDSIVTLNLSVTPYSRDTLDITLCSGQSFTVGSNTYNQTGTYVDTLITAACDSIVMLKLTVGPYKRDTLTISICEGQSFTLGSNSYSQPGVYTDTLPTFSCDSIVLLNLTVGPYKRDTLNISLCNGQSFTVGSNNYSQTGTYIDTLTTASCDSIVLLHLLVSDYKRDSLDVIICEGQSFTVGNNNYAQTGIYIDTLSTLSCDSIVVLNLLVNPYKRDSLNIAICEGQSFTVGSNNYSQTGIYIDTLSTVSCDSIVVLSLLVNPYKRDSLNITICEGQSFTVGNNNYYRAGNYIDTLTTASCDSIVVLNLLVNPYKRDTLNITICEGQSFTVGNNSYSQTGNYIDTLSTLSCDSIVVLKLTVNPYKRDTLNIDICRNEIYTVGNNNYTQTGIYSDTLTTTGCDSIVLLNLTVNLYKKDSVNISICEGEAYTVGSHAYTQTGLYYDTLATNTCDSIVALQLTVTPYKRTTINTSICEGQIFTVGSNSYNQPGTYVDTLSTNACDSIVTLNLTVNPYKRSSLDISICEGQQYFFNDQDYSLAGVYVDTISTTGCDSIVTLNLSVSPYKRGDTLMQLICEGESFSFNGRSYTETGIYFDTLSTTGCDSIAALDLTVVPAPAAHITATPAMVNPGSTVELSTPAAASYSWKTTARMNDSTTQNISAVFYTSAWVYLTTTGGNNGCTASDSVFVIVRTDTVIVPPCGPNTYIYLPNAFVPGSVFGNGIFRIFSSNIRLAQFQVFNKWGQTVFATTNITDGWDGTYKGKMIPGNYVYRVTYYDCNPQMKVKAGNILLIK